MARVLGVILVILVPLVVWQIPVSAQEPPPQTFRSGVDLVRVDAVVLDRLDKPVHGLRVGDFQVFEDGKPVPIQSFTEVSADAGETDGRLIAILLDDATVDPVLTVRVKEIASGFVQRMGPLDELGVIMLNGSATRTTRDRAALLEAIERYQPRIGVSMGVRWGFYALDTIADLAMQLAEAEHPRKTLVCIGPAGLFNMAEPAAGRSDVGVRVNWFEAIRAAARYNVSVYVIDPNGLNGVGSPDTSGFARETGGQTFTTNMFDRAVDRIWREAGNYYLLGYAATLARTGADTRHITVTTTRPDVTIRARRAIG